MRTRQHLFYIVFDVLHCGGGAAAETAMQRLKSLGAGPAPEGDVSAWPLRLRRRLLKEIVDPVRARLLPWFHKPRCRASAGWSRHGSWTLHGEGLMC